MRSDSTADDPLGARGWTIEEVTGRGTPGGKGLATAHSMTGRSPDGRQITAQRSMHGFEEVNFRLLRTAQPTTYEQCPICLAPEPTSAEHVPPAALGGTKMTATCGDCNNRFGSRLEAELVDWWEDAYRDVRVTIEGVPGDRRVRRMIIRTTPDGEVTPLIDRADPTFAAALEPGAEFSLTYRHHDRARYRLGAIKSAYLGACLLLREVPANAEADAVRADLLAARDEPLNARVTASEHCDSLDVYRSQGPAVPGEIALAAIQPGDGSVPTLCVSLARTLLVSWPLGTYFGGL